MALPESADHPVFMRWAQAPSRPTCSMRTPRQNSSIVGWTWWGYRMAR